MYVGNRKQVVLDLESMIDRFGLVEVVEHVAAVCRAKADQLWVDWADSKGAEKWTAQAKALERVVIRMRKAGQE